MSGLSGANGGRNAGDRNLQRVNRSTAMAAGGVKRDRPEWFRIEAGLR